MLATSIKNTILVFLVILILHFLIKNALLDRTIQQRPKSTSEKFSSFDTQKYAPEKDDKMKDINKDNNKQETDKKEIDKPKPIVSSNNDISKPGSAKEVEKEPFTTTCKTDDDEDELYKFVYGDDSNAHVSGHDSYNSALTNNEDIKKYFTGLDVTKDIENKIQEAMKCKSLQQSSETDPTIPLSTTCDPALKPSVTINAVKVKADCGLHQDLPVMTITEYENESSMNGGSLYGNLAAFDSFAGQYEEYECGKN